MKNLFLKLLCVLAFILCSILNAFAQQDLNISSVIFDNSETFILINSQDNDNFEFSTTPKLYIVQGENKAYFDISSAVLQCPPQDLVLSSPDIKEVIVKQFSSEPNIVRVVIKYNESFNPKNIQLKRLNNTLIVRFKTTQVQNYYFQHVYTDSSSSIQELYESIGVQIPVIASMDMISQINSAFKLGSTTEDKNYILTKKDILLPTKYYLDDITIKNNSIQISGIGSYTLTQPFILSNPSRLVYDIPNAYLNPIFRNKEIYINSTDSIKAGQFNKNTVRLVITTDVVDKYLPVIIDEGQKLILVDKTTGELNYNVTKSILISINDEIIDTNTHSVKLIFSKPVSYGIERTQNSFDLSLYNVEKAQELNLNSSLILDGAKINHLKQGGIKLSIPASSEDLIDVHKGLDAKTIRIKIKSKSLDLPKQDIKEPVDIAEVIRPIRPSDGKIYVVLDPGHGGSDCGATRNKIYEKDITLDISKRVEKLLEKKGYVVFMTRTADETVSLQDRVEISENIQPDVFVSIHVNSSNSTTPKGLETHYYKDNSLMLAKTVHASLLNNINASNRGLFRSKFYVINHTTAPAVLLEIGFISNDTERAQLVTESRKQATAKAIAEGIDEYFK